VHRTTFARQAANLCAVKRTLWEHLLHLVDYPPWLVVLDSLPVPVCRFAPATFCRRLRESRPMGTIRWLGRPSSGCVPICGSSGPV
jgi:hypothetical protein